MSSMSVCPQAVHLMVARQILNLGQSMYIAARNNRGDVRFLLTLLNCHNSIALLGEYSKSEC